MPILRLFYCLILLTGISVIPAATGYAGNGTGLQAIGQGLASHTAFYTLSFSRLDPRNYRNGIAGGLKLEFVNDCDGYTLNQRFVIETSTEDGPTLSDMTLNSWEARDGEVFRFKLKDVLNGDVDQELDGEAIAPKGSHAGAVHFSLPQGVELALPPGLLFPTQHTIRLLALAHAGKNWLQAPVYDGSSADGYTDVGGFIGSELPAESGDTPVLESLRGLRSWRVRLAYFTSEKTQDAPDYEIGYRLYDNGVVDDIVFDYGDYAIRATLQKLTIKPKDAC